MGSFRSNDKLQLALTQQNPKQKLFRLHRKIADRRGLWPRKQATIIIWIDGRMVWSSPTSSSRGRRCGYGSRGRRKCFFRFINSFPLNVCYLEASLSFPSYILFSSTTYILQYEKFSDFGQQMFGLSSYITLVWKKKTPSELYFIGG